MCLVTVLTEVGMRVAWVLVLVLRPGLCHMEGEDTRDDTREDTMDDKGEDIRDDTGEDIGLKRGVEVLFSDPLASLAASPLISPSALPAPTRGTVDVAMIMLGLQVISGQ